MFKIIYFSDEDPQVINTVNMIIYNWGRCNYFKHDTAYT
jgi:hypothetical protein